MKKEKGIPAPALKKGEWYGMRFRFHSTEELINFFNRHEFENENLVKITITPPRGDYTWGLVMTIKRPVKAGIENQTGPEKEDR